MVGFKSRTHAFYVNGTTVSSERIKFRARAGFVGLYTNLSLEIHPV
jgi:hypothetical protein